REKRAREEREKETERERKRERETFFPSHRNGRAEEDPSGAVCTRESCYAVYLGRRTFAEARRGCRERGGDLATLRDEGEAGTVGRLLAGLAAGGAGGDLKLWIGLRRQPRQCSGARGPLRGFGWVTGDRGTGYANWRRAPEEETRRGGRGGGSCPAARCVVLSHSRRPEAAGDNHAWLDGSCQLAVEGYLCRSPGAPVSYATPFGAAPGDAEHVPFGSVATAECPGGRRRSALCRAREDGRVGWSRDPATLCADDATDADDAHDPCRHEPCPHACPPGYEAAGDEGGAGVSRCRDVDECLETPCRHLCANADGSYRCHCLEGFAPSPADPRACLDVDECAEPGRCQQACGNYPGGFACRCGEGFALDRDGFSCSPHPPLPLSSPPGRHFGPIALATSPEGRHVGPTAPVTSPEGRHFGPITPATGHGNRLEPATRGPARASTAPGGRGEAGTRGSSWSEKSEEEEEEGEQPHGSGAKVTQPGPPARGPRPNLGPLGDDRGLLVALLVPVCIFLVVMLALAVAYGTRCACERPRPVTDCYRWV
uniref:CD248 molecule n=1 Tax=Callorhinchus milii TaxID=7868 RepID=A0A4W3GMY9_CALMI